MLPSGQCMHSLLPRQLHFNLARAILLNNNSDSDSASDLDVSLRVHPSSSGLHTSPQRQTKIFFYICQPLLPILISDNYKIFLNLSRSQSSSEEPNAYANIDDDDSLDATLSVDGPSLPNSPVR